MASFYMKQQHQHHSSELQDQQVQQSPENSTPYTQNHIQEDEVEKSGELEQNQQQPDLGEIGLHSQNDICSATQEQDDETKQLACLEGMLLLAESHPDKNSEAPKCFTDQSSTQTDLHTEEYPQCVYTKNGKRHTASSGDSTKDPETLSPPNVGIAAASTKTLNAEPLSSPNGNISISSTSAPYTDVEGVLQSCLANAEHRATRLLQQAMDSVQSQVLCALHRAASDIFEHIKKDAAQRILVAEQKSAALEQELVFVKQQAVRMLLRLKSDSESQVSEMERRYHIERRRAQDAESKLIAAQDTTKRLKIELRKKNDILEKIQKTVQPMNGDNQNKSAKNSEAPDFVYKEKGFEEHVNSEENRYSVENVSLVSCDPDFQPSTAALGHSDIATEETNNEDDHSQHQPPTRSSMRLMEDIDLHSSVADSKEDQIQEIEVKNVVLPNVGCSSMDHTEQMEESQGGMALETKSDVADSNVEDRDNSQMVTLNVEDSFERNMVSKPHDSHENVENKDLGIFKDSNSSIKGFYVRRKSRMNSRCPEKEENEKEEKDPAIEINSEKEIELKMKCTETLSRLIQSKGTEEVLDLQRCSKSDIDVTHSSDCTLDSRPENTDGDTHDNTYGNDPGVATSSWNEKGFLADFARPDYEVATSLAELASLGREMASSQVETCPLVQKDIGFIKPGRTGLRMKRKGISFEKKMELGRDCHFPKNPRIDKGEGGLFTESSTGRQLRTRTGRTTTSRDDFSLIESSRDSRRLLQGARQLLCLAEKKWR